MMLVPVPAYLATLLMGGFFVLLGIILIVCNSLEKRRYYNSILLTQRDIRESLTRDPQRLDLDALQVGGRIALVVGTLLLIGGGILRLVLY